MSDAVPLQRGGMNLRELGAGPSADPQDSASKVSIMR